MLNRELIFHRANWCGKKKTKKTKICYWSGPNKHKDKQNKGRRKKSDKIEKYIPENIIAKEK